MAAALSLAVITTITPSHAQAPTLGTNLPTFGVLAGSTVTNTGPTTISGTAAFPGNVGVSPGNTFTGAGSVTFATGGVQHLNDAFAVQAQSELTTAYSNLMGRITTVNLTGQNLGGLTLVPGVYSFSSSAQLTGALTLNGLGNPNSVFIFNIASTLTTASAASVLLIDGAQGGNVFWRVGSSATLGTTTAFVGDILAQAGITLNTGATITCGAAWARTGAVTLDTNTISLCDLVGGAGVPLGPTGFPLFVFLLPTSATANQFAVAAALDNFVAGGGILPLAFANLLNLSPADLANALTRLSGEAGTGVAQVGVQSMNSFLSLLTNPFGAPFAERFGDDRGFGPDNPAQQQPSQPSQRPLVYKAPFYKGAAFEPARWGTWASAYGGQNNTTGNLVTGSHDRSSRMYGYAVGFDRLVTPYTVVGFAFAGGATNYGLSDGLGGGHTDMFQAAIYSLTRVNAAYVSTALAYAWHRASTDRLLTVAGADHLTSNFSAHNIGARIEGGYRFVIPGVFGMLGFGFTPYGALQVQAFRTPSYSEVAVSGSPTFALAYEARTTTTARTELGAWFDRSYLLTAGILTLRSRAAWAHDEGSNPSLNASFQALPGSSFMVIGAASTRDSLLSSASAEIRFRNGITLAGRFDSELAQRSQSYTGTGLLRYTW